MHRNYIDITLELFLCNKYKYNQFKIIFNGKIYYFEIKIMLKKQYTLK